MKSLRVLSKMAFAALVFVLISGCAMMPAGIAASSTPICGREFRQLGRVVASDTSMALLGVIPITGSSTIRDALDKGVKSRNGDAMINITVESYTWYFIVLSTHTTRIEGDVIQFTD